MTIHTNVGGVWKDVSAPEVNISGSWKTVATIEVNIGGTWKSSFVAGGFVNQPNITEEESFSGQQVECGIRFQQLGDSDEIDKDGNTIFRVSGEWWSEEPETGIGNDYDIRCASMNGGTLWDIQAAAVGTWINIGAGRNWAMLRTFGKGQEGVGSDHASGNMEIRDVATETVQASFVMDITATIDP